ncbi:hypothetical protein C8R47DRAFT_683245 [Mycena vitilis]|nr:hypothetical protein C8R47DRAFT_683245 [Mycena vitilis]
MNHNSPRRSSLFAQAGDALATWTKSRRRPSVRQPAPQPVLAVPHVIDISAPPPDEELEERQRLRDAAAQSIGLGPLLEPTEEAAEEEQEIVELPPFPASGAALAPFAALTDSLPKYYPPGSLRIFALARQWKSRHLLLSVPAGSVSHLHLFKGPNPDDRELERLEINVDSVVFVAESVAAPGHDPDAPAHIVKVAGADVGARRRDWNATDDAGRTVWLLQLATPADAQRWISAIKTAIFDQRTQRAGLAPSTAVSSATEPRGDMDVMLSMRIHAANSPPAILPAVQTPTTARPAPPLTLPPTPTSPTDTYAASIAPSASSRSVRSVATAPSPSSNPFTTNPFSFSSHSTKSSNKSNSTPPRSTVRPDSSGGMPKGNKGTAVAALKGLFDRGRPRSSSGASFASVASTSAAHTPASHFHAPSHASSYGSAEEMGLGESFGRMGTLLVNGHANGRTSNGDGGLERRIMETRDDVLASSLSLSNGRDTVPLPSFENEHAVDEGQELPAPKRRSLAFGFGGSSVTALQPPPRRRRWTGASGVRLDEGDEASTNGNATNGHPYAGAGAGGHPYANGYMNGHANGYIRDGNISPSTPGVGGMYAHPHANGSSGTAGSFGVRSVRTVGEDREGSSMREGSIRTRAESVRTGEGREGSVRSAQMSMRDTNRLSVNGGGADCISERSVSTGRRSPASSVGNGASLNGGGGSGSGKGRRWSTLSRHLTPPASPPPGSIPHPYAASPERERERDRPSSRNSFGSAGKGGWGRGKRASGISVSSIGGVSSVSVASMGSNTNLNSVPSPPRGSGSRLSVPPPPRPAPTSALPPAPGESHSPNGRTSFRESRASSLSVSFRDPPAPTLPAQQAAAHTKSASASSSTSTFRESMSMTHRALRLSLMAPKPPPAGVLPPRPDEVSHEPGHQRTGSNASTTSRPVKSRTSINGSSINSGSGLYAIPASPAFPPPRGPLPPTPSPASAPAPAPATTRHTSLKLKQRLRILSAPPAPHPAAPQQHPEAVSRPTSADATTPAAHIVRARPGSMTLASFLSASTPTTPTTAGFVPLHPAAYTGASTGGDGTPPPPQTPIGEKIIQWHTQNDPSFLEMSAVSTPVLTPVLSLRALPISVDPPAPEDEYAEIVSLPPPRRGSRQISIKDVEREPTPPLEPQNIPLPRDSEAEGAGPGPGSLFSISRHGSVVSLGNVTTV